MPTRYLKPGIRHSDRIEAVQDDPNAEILFYRLLIIVDDFGRTDARPLMVKSECFPIRMRVTADNCMQWLKKLDSVGLIGLYEVDGKPYLQIAKWDNKPRAQASKFPEPSADVYKRMQMLPVTETETETVTVTVNRKPKTETKDLSAHTAQTKGTRLPEDWLLPKPWGEWALKERPELTADEVRKMAETFKDHWIANANRAIGKKADWFATWRNWVRNQKITKSNGKGSDPAWWSSDTSIEAKGREYGIFARPGESMNDFKGRIQSKIGENN